MNSKGRSRRTADCVVAGGGRRRKDNNLVVGYVLKADIKHYFPSVDHAVLVGIIVRKIGDEQVLWLVRKILSHNATNLSRGMPIGNLTSQFFANLYLNELDYFVKHELRAKYYIRYVDDFVILDASREKLLSWRGVINDFLRGHLKLELHEEKSQVYPLHRGINFLGFRMFYHYRLPKKSNLRKLERRMLGLEKAYRSGETSIEEIAESFDGWLAYAENGDTFLLRRSLIEKFNRLLGVNLQNHSKKAEIA